MRDRNGVRWLTVRESAAETRLSERTIRTWLSEGLESQTVQGRRWIPEVALFARFRASLTEHPRVKTRLLNRE